MPTAAFPTIKRTGVLFRPGDYGAVTCADDVKAGKKGVYTEADMHLLAGDDPVPIRMSHYPTLLEGDLGDCTRRFVGFDNGVQVLMGEWDEPEPLAQLLKNKRRTVSIEVNPLTKQVAAVALEVNPHICDAAFFSQAVEEAYAKFSRGDIVTPLSGAVSGEKPMSEAIATPPATEHKPSILDQLRAFFSGAKPEELDAVQSALTTAKTGKTPRELELEAQVAQFQADAAKSRTDGIRAAAVAKANALVEGGKIKGKGNQEYNEVVAAFCKAGAIDAAEAAAPVLAFFSDDTERATVATFSLTGYLGKLLDGAKEHGLSGERTSNVDVGAVAVFEQGETTVKDEEGKPKPIATFVEDNEKRAYQRPDKKEGA